MCYGSKTILDCSTDHKYKSCPENKIMNKTCSVLFPAFHTNYVVWGTCAGTMKDGFGEKREQQRRLYGDFPADRKSPPQSHTTASFGLYIVLFLFYPTGVLTSEKQWHCFLDERQNCVTRSDLFVRAMRGWYQTQSP